ncbi:MAG TPA: restriction endonuclease subunit S [Mycobacteriales bacterium]|nr:restriction endonuclease subunit S [Mycobacteriales bacterium]
MPLLRVVDLANDRVELSAAHRISRALDDEFRRSRLRGGEVLLSIQGTVGRVALSPPEAAGANISRTLAVIEPDGRVDARFLRYFLMSYRQHFKVGGTTRASLNISDLRPVPVPVPPLDEQHRIVAALEDHLSRLDAGATYLTASRTRAASLALDTFADALASCGDTADVRLGDVARWGSGGTPRSRDPRYYANGTVPWVVSGDLRDAALREVQGRITEAAVKESAAKWVPAGAVLVAMYGATIGRTAITEFPVTTNQAVAHAVPTGRVNASFLFWFLRSQRRAFAAAGKGGAQPNISQTILKAWSLPLPDLSRQAQLVDKSLQAEEAADRLRHAAVTASHRGGNLRRSLLQAAFSGCL